LPHSPMHFIKQPGNVIIISHLSTTALNNS
jgi:hypothetical protein